MPFGHVRSQIWDIGMNGPWNDDTSVKQVTAALAWHVELVSCSNVHMMPHATADSLDF